MNERCFLQKSRRERYVVRDDVAPQRGFEPPTYRLGGGRSILLSYWGVYGLRAGEPGA